MSHLLEIPDGWAYIVELFGIFKQVHAPGNYRFFHIWDGEHHETKGILPPDTIRED
jgi:hypothetical protein